MRTTVDFPEDMLVTLRAISRDTGATLSAVAVDLMRKGLDRPRSATINRGRSGFPRLAAVGRPITSDDVRALEDDL